MELEFDGEIINWRGPSPFHFVAVPDEPSAAIESVKSLVTYGWGAIPVQARIGDTDFTTSLFPRGELYLVRRRRSSARPGPDRSSSNAVRPASVMMTGSAPPATT